MPRALGAASYLALPTLAAGAAIALESAWRKTVIRNPPAASQRGHPPHSGVARTRKNRDHEASHPCNTKNVGAFLRGGFRLGDQPPRPDQGDIYYFEGRLRLAPGQISDFVFGALRQETPAKKAG